MTNQLLFIFSMWLTILLSVSVASWLWYKGHREKGLSILACYTLLMAVWCLGHLLGFNGNASLAALILLLNPLMPTTFLHFILQWLAPLFTESQDHQKHISRWMRWLYGSAIILVTLTWLSGGGHFQAWLDFPLFFHLDFPGWVNLIYAIAVGAAAHVVLFIAFMISTGNLRRSIIAMFITGIWGFILSVSFIFPSMNMQLFPYAMLALPSYPILVVYSVVRYRLIEVNAWVSKGVLWAAILTISMLAMSVLLALLAPLGLADLAGVPSAQLILYSGILLFIAGVLYGPAKEFADRLIYPDGMLDNNTLDAWVNAFSRANSWGELEHTAYTLWQQQTRTPCHILIDTDSLQNAPSSQNHFNCQKQNGTWLCRCTSWEETSPGIQRMAETFAQLLASACQSLDRALLLAEAERKRLQQKHLIELGGLTAAIAHELRNPLNIIAMAATQTEQQTRQHIQTQIQRAELLIKDVLSYSGSLELNLQRTDLSALFKSVCLQCEKLFNKKINLEASDGLWITVDAHRIQQVLVNLLDNAAAFTSDSGCVKAVLQKHPDSIRIGIHNNGPRIPDNMLPQLFHPFVSKRAGGSGLGLAIVRRIVNEHQGKVWHSGTEPDWPVTFFVELPLKPTLHRETR
ncbi:sensor histidine kinase [Oleiphilus messinensis]|nr:sensor histidine kinase [Oleiphilus messinensis]